MRIRKRGVILVEIHKPAVVTHSRLVDVRRCGTLTASGSKLLMSELGEDRLPPEAEVTNKRFACRHARANESEVSLDDAKSSILVSEYHIKEKWRVIYPHTVMSHCPQVGSLWFGGAILRK